MFPHRHGNRRAPGLAFALLAGQMANVGFANIPPVTLAAIAGQVLAYLRLDIVPFRWPSISQVCMSAMAVWYRQDFSRLFLAAFFHADEWHLYFNMISFMWKGITLEPRLGSRYFAYMIAVFTGLTGVLYVALGLLAENVLDEPSYLSQCAVGFSGVIFALKVITTHMSSGTQHVLGFIPVPTRYACWAELFLIHILVPRASFLGHLSGIIVGLLYVKGPLRSIMNAVMLPSPDTSGMRSGERSFFRSRYRDWASSASGYTPRAEPFTEGQHQQYEAYTRGQQESYDSYTGGMSEEEQLQQAMADSLREHGTGTSYESFDARSSSLPEPSAPPVDDLAPPYPPDAPPPYITDSPPPYLAHEPHSRTLYPDLSNIDIPSSGGYTPDGTATALSSRGHTYGTVHSPSVSAEEIRRRRLQKFNQS